MKLLKFPFIANYNCVLTKKQLLVLVVGKVQFIYDYQFIFLEPNSLEHVEIGDYGYAYHNEIIVRNGDVEVKINGSTAFRKHRMDLNNASPFALGPQVGDK